MFVITICLKVTSVSSFRFLENQLLKTNFLFSVSVIRAHKLTPTLNSVSVLWLFQVLIETLLERADRAERQLLLLSSDACCKYTHTRRHTEGYTLVSGWGGRSLDGSADDIITNRMEAIGHRVRTKTNIQYIEIKMGQTNCVKKWWCSFQDTD